MASSVLDEFCGSPFWNSSLTWYTDDPDFTPCFEKTVLVWVPCLFLWCFSALEVYYIIKSKKKDIPWNWFNVLKLGITSVVSLLMLSDFATNLRKSSSEFVPSVDIYTPVFKLLSFLLSAALLVYNRKYGLRSSGLLFLFWFLLSLFGAAQFRSEILNARKADGPESYYSYVSYLIYYPLVILMFLLNCFADRPPTITKYPKTKNPCPEEGASFLSRMVFAWFDKMSWRGFRKPLEADDLWDMNHEDSAAEVVPIFEKHWHQTVLKSQGVPAHAKAQFKSDSGQIEFVPAKKKEASILPALLKSFGPMFLFGAALKLVQDLLTFVNPQLLGLIINFVKGSEYTWHGPFYAVLMFLTATIQTIFLAQYFNRMFVVGMRIRTALVSTIYRKSLKISNKARKERTAGEIVNLMAVDAQKFMDLTAYLNMIWSAPLQICLSMYFLWQELGPSVLAGLAVMIILIPVNGFIANKSKVLQIKQMKNKDERVKLMNEVLSGIKVLKLYAWEPSFENQVLKIRDKEIKVLKQAAYLNAGTSFIWSCAPFLVVLATFVSFIFSDKNNILTPERTFKSLTLFGTMSMPMGLLPILLVYTVETYVSVQRINTFMNAEELDPNNVSHDQSDDPLVIENGNFSWGEDPILKNINIKIASKTLTAVVGSVGSGKSSLISAFLGEMDKISGWVNTYGKIAYVSQQAWIQNATLRDNILFGKTYDKKVYDKVIEACALKPDFQMLPGGDQTEIGEKGINLSGGQKQRVSLARAVYADADIYFLDDPLSAVDSHVGKHIFEEVLGPKGLLKDKTRVLVTHGVTYLPQTDNILVITNGEVSESGTYQHLMDKKGAFAEFLIQHMQEQSDDEEDDSVNTATTVELDELKDQLIQSTEVGRQQVVRHRSRVSESLSETGSSHGLNGSLQRQKSEDSTKSHRKGSSGGQGDKLIDAEKSETGSVSWNVYKHYLGSIGVLVVICTVILNMCFQAFSIGSNVWLGIWADDSTIFQNDTVDTAKRDLYLGVYGALGIGQVVVIFFAALALFVGALNAAKKQHFTLLNNILRAPGPLFFDVTPVGRILNRFSKDVDTLDTVLPMTLRGWINCLFSVIGTLAVTSIATPLFIVVIIPIALLYYFIQRFYVATSRQLKRLESVSRSPIYSHFGETVTGVQAIRAFNQQDRFIRESEQKVDLNQVCYYPSIISNRWLAVRLEMIGNLIILFAALFAVLGKDQLPALVGLSISYCLQITQTLNWLVRMTSDVETNIVAVERIKEYAEVRQEAAWELPNQIMSSAWPETGSVSFKNFSVRYRPGLDLVLKGLSFTVNGSEKVGIVGRTGAGKSSLTLSLFRIIEAAEGQITIDGVNIATLGLHTLRSRLTIIPQDAVLFSGSLRMNLDPFDSHSDEEVWRSLEHAHLKSFVKGLPAGLNHEVTEGGENLSVGQRQLICLARALLRKTKVLILDEATAAVDLETDDLIQRTIRTEFKSCTVLTIAHRLNTIMDSDRVIVLDKGRIVEFDTPSSLLAQSNSIFYGMCKDAGLV
ncbi:multidrug resistance-associated protein 1-like isoform X2 [Rhynchophorus ferrugineus]|uniref:multidrug resistance-associated protein 1-like isoform X2 n=1 Tax=Rhynchophorus ferrugineus TaxID=354439 RepID=UPI003FCE3C82